MLIVVNGYVFIDDTLVTFEIREHNEEFIVYEDGELCDDIDDICEFIEEVGGIYYLSVADFKLDVMEDLSLAVLRHVLGTRKYN